MTELRTLLLLELRALYGINKHRHTRDRKAQNRFRGQCAAWVIVILLCFGYVGGLVYGLCTLGLHSIVPAYLVTLASLLILAFGIFTAGNRIFGTKGYDILASMPVKTGNIVLSRFLSLYAEDLLFTLAIMLPGMIVYGVCMKPFFTVYLLAAAAALFIPAIPLVLSTLLGTLVMAVSSRMKHKNLMQTLLMVAFVVAVLLLSFQSGKTAEVTAEQFADLAKTLSDVIGKIYLPAGWLNAAMINGNILYLALFAAVSAAVIVLAVWLAKENFHSIARRLQSFSARHDYQIGTMHSGSLWKALYIRELRRYFSSSIYVTNTIIGPIMGTIMAIALAVTGVEKITAALPLAIDIAGLLPFAFAAVFCMMTTTSVSLSMEGRNLWAVQSMPIPARQLFNSKILLNLSLMLPFYLISLVAMVIAVRPNMLQFAYLVLIPGAMMLFCTVFGIAVNLRFHSFDWEKEETVVKQSLPAALGGFAGFFLALICGVAVFLVPVQYADLAKTAIVLLLLAAAALLCRKNNCADLSKL